MSESDKQLGRILEWQKEHTEIDDQRFGEMKETLKNIPCKDDIKAIVDKSIQENFTNKGNLAKNYLITIAIVLGAITGIVASLKIILAWAGFNIIRP